ncbi:MAG: putative nitrite and sulphite reductase [Candidatus Scalindua rubra]|uniref:Putative nitrite and sulphite reductase n=1 Tax=Candidatus Scalindua rubra TaxID=1872076 RepID=A0A1E3XFH0_9BACT|nr:MAG: putative nitrite and sulphite reductase [Candidatus Scalindua rubra]
MEWDKEASSRLDKIPIFVRRLARSKIEKHAREKGKNTVTLEDVEGAKASFMGTGSVKSDKGIIKANPFSLDLNAGEDKFEILKRSDEYEVEDGSPAMFHIDICRGEDVECPFLIAEVKGLLQKIKNRLREIEFSKKLINRIEGKILPHQRLKIAIASCPNSCSQPQIRDFGVHVRAKVYVDEGVECNGCGNCLKACKEGAIRITGLSNKLKEEVEEAYTQQPENKKKVVTINYDRCVHCGLCAEVCPTGTIKTEKKCYRVMIGGKLGRHPRFADDLIDFADESEVIRALDVCVDAILAEKKEKRFGTLVEKIGIEEFKRRIKDKEHNTQKYLNNKEVVHS